MRSLWDNKSWRLGNIGEQNFCLVREMFIKISWCLILLIIPFFRNFHRKYQKFIFFQHRIGNIVTFLRMFHQQVLKKGRVRRTFWWEPKYIQLKPSRVSVVLAVNQGVKFVNILPKHIRPQKLNCTSNNVVYLFTCKICHKKYTGRTEEFRSRFTNYRCPFT